MWATYKEKVKAISEAIVEAQKPIRILNAIKIGPQVEEEIRNGKFKVLPRLDSDAYQRQAMGFDPAVKIAELENIRARIRTDLGPEDDLGLLLDRITEQYIWVVEMLKGRGTKTFYEFSRKLYGSPKDAFIRDKNTIADMSHMLYEILSGIDSSMTHLHFKEDVPAEEVVNQLNLRFASYFDGQVVAKISDGIVADAAAGGDTVKIRQGAMFSEREIDIYEVHEGWVHVGTTLNGRAQPVAKFLSIGPPRCASTQEGLAVIMEIFTFRAFPARARQINDRIICIDKAEDGANILDVIEYFRTEGYQEHECIANALRVFRGGVAAGGAPFTKDISYCKGFVENYNFFRTAIRAGKPGLIPYIFAGKLHVDDIPLIYAKHREGLIEPPKFLPMQFRDLNGIAVWMSFSSFFNRVDLQSVQDHYDQLFRKFT